MVIDYDALRNEIVYCGDEIHLYPFNLAKDDSLVNLYLRMFCLNREKMWLDPNTPRDIEGIKRFISKARTNPRSAYFVICYSGTYIGHYSFKEIDPRFGTFNRVIYILPEYQQRGIGSRVCKKMLVFAASVGFKRVFSMADSTNYVSMSLNRGFIFDCVLPDKVYRFYLDLEPRNGPFSHDDYIESIILRARRYMNRGDYRTAFKCCNDFNILTCPKGRGRELVAVACEIVERNILENNSLGRGIDVSLMNDFNLFEFLHRILSINNIPHTCLIPSNHFINKHSSVTCADIYGDVIEYLPPSLYLIKYSPNIG